MDVRHHNKFSNKAMLFAVLAVAAVAVTGIMVTQQQALAQSGSNSTNGSTNNAPTIKGSVSILNATNAFVKSNVKVDFNTAANTAKAQMANSVIVAGRLSDVQGYLAYTFTVANYDAGTSRTVIVDAGNGSVLYTSGDMPLYNGGLGGGCHHGGGYGWGQHMRSGSSTSFSGTSGTKGSGLSVLGNNYL